MDEEFNGWMLRNLPHTLHWSNGINALSVYARDGWIRASFYPSAANRTRSVYVDIQLFPNHARIADLLGNSDGTQYHNRKVGTLVVNLAIQALQVLYSGRLHEMTLTGETCPRINEKDTKTLEEDVARRAHFWSRFGLVLEDLQAPRSYMSANLADLKVLNRGDILEGIPTTIKLAQFWRQYHTPRLHQQDIDALSQIELDIGELAAIEDNTDLLKEESRISSLANIPVTLFWVIVFLGGVYLTLNEKLPAGIKVLFVLTAFASYQFFSMAIFNAAKKILGLTHRLIQLRNIRSEVLKNQREILERLSTFQPGCLERFITTMKYVFPEHTGALLKAHKFDFYGAPAIDEKHFLIEVGELLQIFKKSCAHRINSTRVIHSVDVNEFLFGLKRNYIHMSDLRKFTVLLKQDFEVHINRLLRDIETHEIYIDGNSDSNPKDILEKLSSIARIDFYTNTCAYNDEGVFHMKVHLREGTLNFNPDWSAYNDTREKEALPVLMYLLERKLTDICFIDDGIELIEAPREAVKFICAVFDLTNSRFYTLKVIRDAFRHVERQAIIE